MSEPQSSSDISATPGSPCLRQHPNTQCDLTEADQKHLASRANGNVLATVEDGIHPIFCKENFTDPELDRSLIEPVLRLATRLITADCLLAFWHLIFFGRTDKMVPGVGGEPKSKKDLAELATMLAAGLNIDPESVETVVETPWVVNDINGTPRRVLMRDIHPKRPVQKIYLKDHVADLNPAQVQITKSIMNEMANTTVFGTHSEPRAIGICHPTGERASPPFIGEAQKGAADARAANENPEARADYNALQFFLADTLCHELAHAAVGLARPNEWRVGNEFRFILPGCLTSKEGYEWTNFVFSGIMAYEPDWYEALDGHNEGEDEDEGQDDSSSSSSSSSFSTTSSSSSSFDFPLVDKSTRINIYDWPSRHLLKGDDLARHAVEAPMPEKSRYWEVADNYVSMFFEEKLWEKVVAKNGKKALVPPRLQPAWHTWRLL